MCDCNLITRIIPGDENRYSGGSVSGPENPVVVFPPSLTDPDDRGAGDTSLSFFLSFFLKEEM